MQDYELTAWLGDVEVTPEQWDSLMRASDMIDSRYSGDMRRDYGATAFNTAAQVILGDATLTDVAEAWRKARRAERAARAALTGAIIAVSGDLPETYIDF